MTELTRAEFQGDADPEEVWSLLVEELKIKEGRLNLPKYFTTSTVSRDTLGPGMRLEFQSVGAIYPARIEVFDEKGRRLEIACFTSEGEAKRWRTYSFLVEPSLRPNLASLRVEIQSHGGGGGLLSWLERKLIAITTPAAPSIARIALEAIIREIFPKMKSYKGSGYEIVG